MPEALAQSHKTEDMKPTPNNEIGRAVLLGL